MKTRVQRLIFVGLGALALGESACGSSGNSPAGLTSGISGGGTSTSGAFASGPDAGASGTSGSDSPGSSGQSAQTGASAGDSVDAGLSSIVPVEGGTSGGASIFGADSPEGGPTSGSNDDASVLIEAGKTSTISGGSGGTGGPGNTCAKAIPAPVCTGPAGAYHNPAMGNIGTHDPSVVQDGCTFYLFETNHNITPAATSTDLINWKTISAPSVTPKWWTSGTQIWAPDVHYANGKFWNYYALWHGSLSTAQIGLATNVTLNPSDPGYQWVDQGVVIDQPTGGGSNVNCIDPDLFIDDDGTWWLTYGSFNDGIRVIQLDSTTGLPMKPVVPAAITNHLGEGSSLVKHNGYYYSFVSRGKCCSGTSSAYEIVYGRSKNIKGPYMTKSGQNYSNSAYTDATDALLRVGSDGNTGGEGGQSFFEENGQWYMDYHTYNPGAQGLADLDVRPIYFDSSDWVTFDCSQAAK